MTQIIDTNSYVALEELYRILLKKSLKPEQKNSEELKTHLHELFKNLNPRFFEVAIPVKAAMQRVYNSHFIFRSHFDISRMF
jgi:ubiquinone/menaquinone biosynthesis C-methylase UbiE